MRHFVIPCNKKRKIETEFFRLNYHICYLALYRDWLECMSDTVPKKPPHKSSFPLAAWMASVSVTNRISMANKQSLAHTSPRVSWRHFFLVPVKLVAGPGRLAVTFAPLLLSLHPTSLQSMTYGTLLGRPRRKGRRSGAGLWFCWDAYLRKLKLGIIVQSCCRWKAFPSFWGHDDIKTHSKQATPRSWLLRIPGPRNNHQTCLLGT